MLFWCDAAPCLLPAALSGTLTVTDYQGQAQQIDATQLTLTSVPVFVE